MFRTVTPPRLMAVLAHPDDESLGVGGTLAKYASEGVDVLLLTATRGDSGHYRGYSTADRQHPGSSALERSARRSCARRQRSWACGKFPFSITGTSISTARIHGRQSRRL